VRPWKKRWGDEKKKNKKMLRSFCVFQSQNMDLLDMLPHALRLAKAQKLKLEEAQKNSTTNGI
jgi:hypothetical protein